MGIDGIGLSANFFIFNSPYIAFQNMRPVSIRSKKNPRVLEILVHSYLILAALC